MGVRRRGGPAQVDGTRNPKETVVHGGRSRVCDRIRGPGGAGRHALADRRLWRPINARGSSPASSVVSAARGQKADHQDKKSMIGTQHRHGGRAAAQVVAGASDMLVRSRRVGRLGALYRVSSSANPVAHAVALGRSDSENHRFG